MSLKPAASGCGACEELILKHDDHSQKITAKSLFVQIRKIIIVVSSLGLGGVERVVSNLATAWIKSGKRVTILTTFLYEDESKDFFPLSERVKRIRLSDHSNTRKRGVTGNLRRMLVFRKLIQSEDPDVVISFMDHINVLTLIALLGCKVPVIVNETGDPFHQPIGKVVGWLRPRLYKLASATTALNSLIAQRMENEWNLPKVNVIPNSLPNLIPEPIPWNLREKIILSVGRLSLEKGHDLLLKAWAKIYTNFPDWKLRIVGDGVERSNLEDQIITDGLNESVELLGKKFPVWPYYQQARVFVLPSRYEAFGNVLIEAMAMGCACISTNCSGPQSIINHEVNGLLVANEKTELIANSIVRLLSDGSFCIKLSENGIRSREQYSSKSYIENWDKILQK